MHFLHHQLVQMIENIGKMLFLAAAPCRHISQQRFFAKIEFHNRRHEAVNRLVVGNSGAHRIGKRDVAGFVRRHESRHA
jgi:hypothetical protein